MPSWARFLTMPSMIGPNISKNWPRLVVNHADKRVLQSGQPVPAHMKHRDRITTVPFSRWLNLWKSTTDDLMFPDAAKALQAKAERDC